MSTADATNTKAPQTADAYLQLLQKSQLVDRPDLVRAIKQFKEETKDSPELRNSIVSLSRFLMKHNLITAWQHAMLMEGRHKGFFLGKYVLMDHLGTGGMSTVYLGEHKAMKRRVALKVLHRARLEEKTFLPRFLREAQAIASLNHPNVVQVYDVDSEGRTYYMAMEYIEGIDLQKRIDRKGPLNYPTVAHCIRQAADGLAHAHARGVIHRDIKPANLLVDRTGTLKLLDLGLVQLTGTKERSLTVEHNEKVLGTADYLAPEQAIDSHNIDHRADIYSLGCTMYFLLTGSQPFPEGTVVERLIKHQTAEPTSIYEFRPDCPDDLVDLCERMMSKKPERRPQSCKEVSDELRAWLRGLKQRQAEAAAGVSPQKPKPKPKPKPAAKPRPTAALQTAASSNSNGQQQEGELGQFLHTVSLSSDEVAKMYSAHRRPGGQNNVQIAVTVIMVVAVLICLGIVLMLISG